MTEIHVGYGTELEIGATCPACDDLSSWEASRCESCGWRLGVLPPGDLQSARDHGRGTLGET